MFRSLIVLFALLTSVAWSQPKSPVLKSGFVFQNPPFKECHASTLVEVSPGRILAAWFGGDYEKAKNVEIWTSLYENGKWSKPVSVADGVESAELRYPTWNPVLFKSRSGKLTLFYKVGPDPVDWWGEYKTSPDNGKTWSKSTRLPDGILGPIKNKPVQLADGTILSPSSTETHKTSSQPSLWRAHMERSTDDGVTWSRVEVDRSNPFDVIQPSVLFYGGNRLQILCRSKENRVVESWSADGGQTWGKLALTELPNPNSGTDAVTLKSGLQVLVYNPTVKGKEWDQGRQKLSVAVSKDGKTWTDVVVLEDERKGEFSYPAVVQSADGKVHVTYTYNRVNIRHVVLSL